MKNKHHSKTILKIIFYITIIILVLVINQKNLAKTQISHKNYQQKIIGPARVVDGDTIIINKSRIRLLNIDSAESKQNCYDKDNIVYPCGLEATSFLKKLIGGKEIYCLYSKKDIYERVLGECFLGSLNINNEMVKNGMAVIYSYNRASKELIDSRQYAKDNKLGLWQGSFEIPRDYRKRTKR
tara:strand:+ start:1028 stop:1576 length:549 start_codon:yes stop_codon:yes gene_type:complete